MKLTLGYSPCPNDTFIFHALTHDLIDSPFDVRVEHHDVETLNEKARRGELDVTKISFHAFAHVMEDYGLLRSGGALGRGVGPIVVAQEEFDPMEIAGKSVVIPGELTTAHLLLQLYDSGIEADDAMIFDEIMPAVANGKFDAGLVIHEGRFTYEKHGLEKVLDLGEWWERETGELVPLGGILAKRELGRDTARELEEAIRRSIEYAYDNPEESREYIQEYAQEMEPEVIDRHIDLYVNDYSLDMGDEGVRAVRKMFGRGREAGVVPEAGESLLAASDK